MEDKTFELLEKMYSDFSKRFEKIENNISDIKVDISDMKVDISDMKIGIRKVDTKIDGPITEKIVSLQDGYKLTFEKLVDVDKKLDTLSDKVDNHDIKIQVIEGGKKKSIK